MSCCAPMKTLILLTIMLLVVEICLARKEISYVRFANCPEYKNNSAIYKNVVLKKDKYGKTISIRFDAIVKKEIKRLVGVLTLLKCDNSEDLDSCEYYMRDFKVNNCCDIMGKNNQIWTAGLANSNFPRSCPIPAGTYRLNDTKLDSDMQLALMPIPVALWKLKIFAYDSGNDNIMICCTDLHVKVFYARRQ